MDKFTKEVVMIFFILLTVSFVLGAYHVIYKGTTEEWKHLPVYEVIFFASNVLLLIFDLPVFLYLLVIPPFVSSSLPTLAVIIVLFFMLLNISYLYFLSLVIASFIMKKKLA